MKNFKSKFGYWAIVTGASSGIGEGYARMLASLGLNVVLLARREELLQQKLSKEIKKMYAMPWEEEPRRYVLIDGPGPHQISKKMISEHEGDFADIMADYAVKLKETEIPILLIYAKKGLISRKEAIRYAQRNF